MAASGGNFPPGDEGRQGGAEKDKSVINQTYKHNHEYVAVNPPTITKFPGDDRSTSTPDKESKNKNATGSPKHSSSLKKGEFIQNKMQKFQISSSDEHPVSLKKSKKECDAEKRKKPDQCKDGPEPEPATDVDKNAKQDVEHPGETYGQQAFATVSDSEKTGKNKLEVLQNKLDTSFSSSYVFVIKSGHEQEEGTTEDDVSGETYKTGGESQRHPIQSPDEEKEQFRMEKEEISKGQLCVLSSKSPITANNQGGQPDENASANIQIGEENGKVYKNILFGTEELSEDQTGGQKMDNDDDTLPESNAELSRSSSVSSVETIEGAPEEENSDVTQYSLDVLKSMTHIPDDNRKTLDNDRGNISSVRGIDEPKKGQMEMEKENPVPHDLEDKNIGQDLEYSNDNKSTKGKSCSDTTQYTLDQVEDKYLLLVNDSQPLEVPQLDGKSNVSLSKKCIFINGKMVYYIHNEDGKIIIKEVGKVQSEGQNNESVEGNSTNKSESVGVGKVRSTSPCPEEMLNTEDVEISKDDNSNSQISHAEGEAIDSGIKKITDLMKGLDIKGQQQTETMQNTETKQLQTTAEQTPSDSRAAGTDTFTNSRDLSPTVPPRNTKKNKGQEKSETSQKPIASPRKLLATPEQAPGVAIAAVTSTSTNPTGTPPMVVPRKPINKEEVKFTRELVDSKNIKEGSDHKFECCVSHPNLTVRWLKDGEPLEYSERIKAVSSETTHSLEIQNVVPTDSGEYTVKVGKIQSNSTVTVEEKPVTFTLPIRESIKTQAGNDVTLTCEVSKPDLEAKWTACGRPVNNSEKFQLVSKGMVHKLVVRDVQPKDGGMYVVSVGEIQSTCTLTIHGWTFSNESLLTLKCGDSLTMKMNFNGPEPTTLVTHNGKKVQDDRLKIEKEGHTVKCSLHNVRCTDEGTYFMHSKNDVGEGAIKRGLKVIDKPSVPKNLTACADPPQSVRLTWEKPDHENGSSITGYKVLMCGADENSWIDAGSSTTTDISVRFRHSKPLYHFKVAAENEAGQGDFTEVSYPIKTEVTSVGKHKQLGIPVKLYQGSDSKLQYVICKPNRCTKLRYLLNIKYKSEHLKEKGVDLGNDCISIYLKESLKNGEEEGKIRECIEMIFDITEDIYIGQITVKKRGHEVVQKLMNDELVKAQQLFAEYFEEHKLLVYVCPTAVQEKAREVYLSALKYLQVGNHVKEFDYKIEFEVVCNCFNVPALISSNYPDVRFRCRMDFESDKCKCSLEGPNKEDLDEAFTFLQTKVVDEHPCNSESFENVLKVTCVEEETLKSFLQNELKCIKSETANKDDLFVDINMKAKRVVIIASSQNIVDSVTAKFRNCLTYKQLDQKSNDMGQKKLISGFHVKGRVLISETGGKLFCVGSTDKTKEFIDMCTKDEVSSTKVANENEYENLSLKPYLMQNKTSKSIVIEDRNMFNLIKTRCKQGLPTAKGFEVTIVEQDGRYEFKVQGHDEDFKEFESHIKALENKIKKEIVSVDVTEEQAENFCSFKSQTEEKNDVIINLTKTNKESKPYQKPRSRETCFENGTTLRISNGITEDFWKDLLVEVKEGKGKSFVKTCQSRKKTQLFVPLWTGIPGEDDGTHVLQNSTESVLRLVTAYDCTHVCLSLDNRCNWPLRKFIKQVLKSVKSHGKSYDVIPIVFELCLDDMKEFQDCCKIIGETETLESGEDDLSDRNVPVTGKENMMKCIEVCVVSGKLDDFQADVLVNTTSKELNLQCGAVSKSLLQKAGKEMQNECNTKYKNGIKYGKFAVTNGYLLFCKNVFHGALEEYKEGNRDVLLQTLGMFVLECLNRTSSLKLESIAFPAIGIGQLGYPIHEVAKVMFNSIKLFEENERNRNRMLNVYFVIYPKTFMNIFVREQEELQKAIKAKPARPGPPKSRQIIVSGVKVKALIAPMKTCGSADALIHLWDKDQLYKVLRNNTFLKEAGIASDFFEKRDSSMKQKSFETNGGNLKVKRIIHVPVKLAGESLMQGFRDGIFHADKKESSSAIAFFERESPFLVFQEKLGYRMIDAMKDIAGKLKHLKNVTLVVEGMPNPTKIFQIFEINEERKEEDISLEKRCRPLVVCMIGWPESIDRAKKMLTDWSKSSVKTVTGQKEVKMKESVPVQESQDGQEPLGGEEPQVAAYCEPQPQEIERTEMDEESIKEKHQLVRFVPEKRAFLTGYVLVTKVPVDYNFENLSAKLVSCGLPVGIKKLIYRKGSGKALFLCFSSADAEKLSGNATSPFEFRSIEREVLAPFECVIGQTEVEMLKKQGKLDKLKEELKAINADVNGNVEVKVKVHTSVQMSWALEIKKQYCSEQSQYMTVSADGFEHVVNVSAKNTCIPDIPMKILNILKQETEMESKPFDKMSGIIEFSERGITITKLKDTSDQTFKTFSEECRIFVENLKKMEYEEVDVDEKYIEKVPDMIQEIEKIMKKRCCTFISDEKKIFAYFDNYEGVKQIKHHFLVKQNKIKTTGRRKRTAQDPSDNEPTSLQPEYQSMEISYVKQTFPTFEWERDASHVETYKTAENIQIYVYKANLLNLDVDCIVNAANDSLSHGGGVARAIAVGAGKQLDLEGKDYIRKYGKISVGHVMSTTAGKLPYKIVIHAVGPRWSDYSYKERQNCENDLVDAVYNSFIEAEKRGMKSIALPAISSAIFGVPDDLCVSMYVQATLKYSQDQTKCPLAHIHFVDINLKIISLLQNEFDIVLNKREVSPYLKQFGIRGQRRHDSSMTKPPLAQMTAAVHEKDGSIFQPKHTLTEKSEHVFSFCDSEDKRLVVYKGDVLKVKHTAIVVAIDDRKTEGRIAREVTKRIPYKILRSYKEVLGFQIPVPCPAGSVAITDGFGSGFYKIIHVVLPAKTYYEENTKRRQYLKQAYHNVLYRSFTDTNTNAVAMVLFGIDDTKTEDVDMCADVFLEEYVLFAKEKLCKMARPFDVRLVLHTEEVLQRVSGMFKNVVEKQKSPLKSQAEGQGKQPVGENEKEDHYETIKSVSSTSFDNDEWDDCAICMEKMTNPETLKCGHKYCKECIDTHFQYKKTCPTCGAVCGMIIGDQPHGTMNVSYYMYSGYCAGYPECGRIEITYSFPDGKQEDNHPNPGKWYKGITRTAYLPDNDKGRKICKMLDVAFKRKLVFTIGRSRTTGQEGVITWNDIHHKTDPRPNTQFGYPDPTYLSRVKEELEAKGVTEEDIVESNTHS